MSSDVEPVLFDSGNVESYYSIWQVLLAAEVVDAGVRFRVNLADEKISRAVHDALRDGKTPGSGGSLNLLPVHADSISAA